MHLLGQTLIDPETPTASMIGRGDAARRVLATVKPLSRARAHRRFRIDEKRR
jgi:hypothetical protein